MDQIQDVIEDADEAGVTDAARQNSNSEASTSESQVGVEHSPYCLKTSLTLIFSLPSGC